MCQDGEASHAECERRCVHALDSVNLTTLKSHCRAPGRSIVAVPADTATGHQGRPYLIIDRPAVSMSRSHGGDCRPWSMRGWVCLPCPALPCRNAPRHSILVAVCSSDVWDRSRLAHGGRTDGSRPDWLPAIFILSLAWTKLAGVDLAQHTRWGQGRVLVLEIAGRGNANPNGMARVRGS